MSVFLDHRGTVAVVTIDNPPVNALMTAVRARLLDVVSRLDDDPAVAAVVLAGAGRLFVGGADIGEFDRPPEAPSLPDLIVRIEASAKPWVAAIHGATLGGGLELALGCQYRVAAPGATMGLPEVTLGIIPGAGGTQRLPRLIGLPAAIPVIAERAMLNTERAAEVGLIDRVVHGSLIDGAVAFATAVAGAPRPVALARRLADPGAGFWEAAAARIAKGARGQAAPLLALAAVRFGVEAGAVAGLARERELFLALRASDEAAALRHLFFAERAALRPTDLRGTTSREIALAGVVGGGTMGAGIAAALRNAGLRVILSERDAPALTKALANVQGIFEAAARRGLITGTQAADRMAGVTGTVGLDGLAGCDVVIEAVFEDLGVKRAVFEELGRLCRADTILATNTSYIDPRLIAAGLPAPDRFVGLHFFSPAQVMKLLEIIPLPETSAITLATALDLARRLDKVPVRAGLCEGFVGNRMLKRTRAEAEAMVLDGVPHAAIDAAMRGFGYAMGPFEMQDMAGLDISFLNREAARAQGKDLPETLGDLLVRAGRKGVKSGGGWYDYLPDDRSPRPSPDAARIIAPLLAAPRDLPAPDIVARIVAAMTAEGQAILSEGFAASAADIDLVQVHGYGFPRAKGGPMFQARRRTTP